MIATELDTGAIKLHRDRYDDTTESTLVNILWACEERDIERITRGGVVTLQPHAPEDWEREEIEREEVEGA